MLDISFDGIMTKLAGVAGALVSMQFLQGTWQARLAMAAAGALLSYYAAAYIAFKLGLPEGLCGFLLGVFGMAVVSKTWEWFQTAPLGQIATDWLKRVFGPKQPADKTE